MLDTKNKDMAYSLSLFLVFFRLSSHRPSRHITNKPAEGSDSGLKTTKPGQGIRQCTLVSR